MDERHANRDPDGPRTLEPDRLEATAVEAIAACGDVRAVLVAMIVANEQLQASVSNGCTRGSLPRDRKDWYD